MLLGPTINLMRTPLGGRGFECFAEDPVLTAELAVAYVRGLQEAGVAATVKHYVGNDSETDRWNYDARIAEQVLRELYLVPFEACVRDAGAMLVMAAYNKVNGLPMTEHERLLKDVLKGEWGFDGVVTSDWHAARSTAATALATLDLAMPGPDGPWGELLARAVADGAVQPEVLDDKVIRLLRLARRVGALAGRQRPASPAGPALAGPDFIDPGLLRRTTAASFVLLRNEQEALPISPDSVGSIALLGPNAFQPTIQGGGSAGVVPVSVSTPDSALRAALAGQAEITAAPGCETWVMVPEPAAGSLSDPDTGEPGPAAGVPRRGRRPDRQRAPDRHLARLVGRRPAGHRLGRERADRAARHAPARQRRPSPDRRGRRRAADHHGRRRHRRRRGDQHPR